MALSAEMLVDCQILYAENVTTLRNTIAIKYPNASSKERADLLAKAIKQILHTNLSSFEASTRTALIQDLLKTAIHKQDFAINAQDVITSYTTLHDTTEETFLNPLTTWLSIETGETPSLEEMQTLVQHTLTLPSSPLEVAPLTPSIHTMAIYKEDSHPRLHQLSTEKVESAKMPTIRPYKKYCIVGATLCLAISSVFLVTYVQPKPIALPETTTETDVPLEDLPLTFLIPEEDYLMAHLQYKTIDETALKDWLTNRGSILADEPYFHTILKAAASYNINPLLMFAITGQEQGFVPKSHKRALEIANNPFNVYGSWQDFNTDIEDTAFIAARTIINLSKGCPSDEDPIQWLNKKYAEDPKWHLGVTALLKQLEEVAGKVITP